jgi:hypothetical protein
VANQSISLKSNNYNYYNRSISHKGQSAHRALINRSNNTQIHYNNTVQTGARCPHGMPGGACPICMGKTGGGGGNKEKERVGMSWGEAYYVFNFLKNIRLNFMQDQKDLKLSRKMLQLLEKLQATELYQKLMAMKIAIQENIAAVKDVLVQMKQVVTRTVVKAVKVVINALKLTVNRLIDVASKLTAIIGEKLRATQETIRDNMRKILAKMLQVEFLSRLIMVFNDQQRFFQEFLLRKIDSLHEKILKFINMVTSISDEDADKQEESEDKQENEEEEEK